MKPDYDIIIVGGGMVGATLALSLSQRSDLTIALIEAYAAQPLAESDPPDVRVSALTHASESLFRELGTWQQLFQTRISTYRDMQVWESSSTGSGQTTRHVVHFDSADIGQPTLGHIIENRHLQQVLLQQCQQAANIKFLCPSKPTGLDLASEFPSLTLEEGQALTANLIIAADGARSPLRDWADIQSKGWAYQQHAVVCTVTTEKSHQLTAWQRFLPTGPLAFLPLADPHQCSIVWSTTPDEAQRLCALPEAEFCHEIEVAFESQLGVVQKVSQRTSFPLHLSHAQDYVKTGFALVGDAAHTIHPLAGQGVNIGLLDATTLADTIITAHQRNRQIGSLHTLKKYQRQRKADNLFMQFTMDGFKRLFGSEIAPIKWARRLGINRLNQTQLLKNSVMKQVSGKRSQTRRDG